MASPFDPQQTGQVLYPQPGTTTGANAGSAGYWEPTGAKKRGGRWGGAAAWAQDPRNTYQPSGYSMWGPTSGPTSGYSQQPGRSSGYQTGAAGTPAKPKGVLSGPTEVNQLYDQFKNDPSRQYFQPRQKSYTEELYESGNGGLNKYYQQARDEGLTALQDRLAAMGVLGSGATAMAMGNFDAKLGAQYGRDMGNLAQAADVAGSRRLSDYWGGKESEFGLAGQADTSLERRERLPLQDKMALATQMAPMFERFSTATADEQRQIWENVIQAIVADGKVDSQAAEQQAEDLFRMYGITIRAADMRNTPKGPAYGSDPYGGIGR